MRKLPNNLAFLGIGILSGIFLSYLINFWSLRKMEMPQACGGKEDQSLIKKLSIDQVWVGRGQIDRTLGDGIANYDEWRTTDGIIVRYIEEGYDSWGKAHEAFAKRVIGAKSVCQYGPTEDGGVFIDKEGFWSRAVTVFNEDRGQNKVEIIIAFEFNEFPGSMLKIIQAPSLVHALAKEKSHYRWDH
jgi:hypothetical protein